MNARVLIVDDEPLARTGISKLCCTDPDLEIVGECPDGRSAVAAIEQVEPDLLLLDIQMPELTGIDFIKALEHPPRIIFTTAYREYALDGYELDVVDYLLKPISLPRRVFLLAP